MRIWDCTTAAQTPEATNQPLVLVSTPEARAVLINLTAHEELAEHQIHERGFLQVLNGSVEVTAGDERTGCGPGTLIVFEPGERRCIRAVESATMMLLLAPWPAPDHFRGDTPPNPFDTPANATLPERS